MDSPSYNISNKGLVEGRNGSRLATFVPERASAKNVEGGMREGSLAHTLKPIGNGTQEINVVQDYQWTLSDKKDWSQWEEIPYIRLKEYKCVDSSIKKQLGFYYQLVKDSASALKDALPGTNGGVSNQQTTTDVYADIWPKDNPTNFQYVFPYFQKTGLELNTEQWTNLGSIGDSLKSISEGAAKMKGTPGAAKMAEKFGQAIDLVSAGSEALLQMSYPNVSVTDRPRIFSSHNERSVTINFVLYNTINPDDWMKNRNLAYLLMSQNLFNKRDLTTGVPPVFYDVYIPGQYFSYASCVTQLKVDYLGNQRLFNSDYIVPDAYDITMVLTEMVKPSKNQFEAIQSGEARDYVKVNKSESSTKAATQTNTFLSMLTPNSR